MPHAWWVTSATQPDRPLEGPYASKDDADTACLRRTDPVTAARALVEGRLPCYYLSRQFEIGTTVEVLHLYRPERAEVAALPEPPVGGSLLPQIVYTYQRSALLTLCRALQLPPPPQQSDRQAILAHMEQKLRSLARAAH